MVEASLKLPSSSASLTLASSLSLSLSLSLSQEILLVEEQSTDIPNLITRTQKEPYTVFTYPNSRTVHVHK